MPTDPISMALSLFFVINVLGNIPLYIGLLARYSAKKQQAILAREFFFALIILLLSQLLRGSYLPCSWHFSSYLANCRRNPPAFNSHCHDLSQAQSGKSSPT